MLDFRLDLRKGGATMDNAFVTHGAVSWNELMTTDVPAAREFYGKLFGWKFQEMPNASMPYTVVNVGDAAIGGIMRIPAEAKGMPPTWGAYVTVSDVDQLAAQVGALGGKVLEGPHDIPTVGRFAVIRDPQGAVLNVITYLPRT
jgi:predicted enzyme related to lactoylglutathione lyase